ncbi:MAG: enoyl-CoA hydratase/isomerase family protein [Alphaproteobacteria bacterium]|nr:enoyl-CoA hydratase/isomerase family protein [Alphaproteobacteria bacterium]
MADSTDEILFEKTGHWGVITLNRPAALNALNKGMVEAFHHKLIHWEGLPSVKAVLVRGAGDRAFCAGGDVRWVHDAARRDIDEAAMFFRKEYLNNSAIHHFPKPYVAMIDGIVMGGGVGVSVHGDFRVAGDRTLFAMPETGIGLFPDVGGGYFMPRLRDSLGLYFALTGARAGPADCVASGIATHYVPTDRRPDLERALFDLPLGGHPHSEIEETLDAFAGDPGDAGLNDIRSAIAETFSGHQRLEDLVAGLKARGGEFAQSMLDTLARMSPTSCKLTFEQMRRGRDLNFDDDMRMEFRMVRRVLQGHDFFEGVRAQLIDKDKSPEWSPAALGDVSDETIAKYFEPLGDDELSLG